MLLLLSVLVGCDEASAPVAVADAEVDAGWTGVVTVADVERWAPVGAGADPFADRPDAVSCPAHGYRPEVTLFEVQTDVCRYATFAQAVPVALRAGDVLRTTVWHLNLWAGEPAEAHLALRIGDVALWEVFVAIPSREAAYPIEVALPVDVAAGTPLYFHLHNHGANSYRLLAVEAVR
ncbi:MAG: hypothetical protein R3F65_27860 [bacterium]